MRSVHRRRLRAEPACTRPRLDLAAIPPLKLAFALSDGRLSLILLAFAGGAVLFMPIGGAVAPRWAPTGVTTSRAALLFPLYFAPPLFRSGALALAAVTFGM